MPWPSARSASSPAKSSPKLNRRVFLSSLQKRAGVLEHLEELRWRLLAGLAAIAVVTLIATFFSKPLLEFLISPLTAFGDYTLYFHSPYDGFLTYLKVSVFTGVLAASPVIFTELWLFVAPGLHRKEKRLVITLVAASLILFLAGAAFAFWVLVPWGLQFFLGFQTDFLRPLLSAGSYLSFLVTMVLAAGIVFDMPVVLLGLVSVGALDARRLRRARKAVIVVFFVVAAMLTPTTDPLTQAILTVPLVLLYEACILAAQWLQKRKN